MKIGMIVAIADEIAALLGKIGEPVRTEVSCGLEVSIYDMGGDELYVTQSGAGEIYAAAATQHLITGYGVELIVNFGICGGLTPEMSLCRICVVGSVVHYDFDTSPVDGCEVGRYIDYPDVFIPADRKLLRLATALRPELTEVICASGDKFIADEKRKRELNALYGARICEMESAGILLTANRCHVPALLVKAVSDSVSGGAEEFNKMACESARACVELTLEIISKLQEVKV